MMGLSYFRSFGCNTSVNARFCLPDESIILASRPSGFEVSKTRSRVTEGASTKVSFNASARRSLARRAYLFRLRRTACARAKLRSRMGVADPAPARERDQRDPLRERPGPRLGRRRGGRNPQYHERGAWMNRPQSERV